MSFTFELVVRFSMHSGARATTVEGIRQLEVLFGTVAAAGSVMASRALEGLAVDLLLP